MSDQEAIDIFEEQMHCIAVSDSILAKHYKSLQVIEAMHKVLELAFIGQAVKEEETKKEEIKAYDTEEYLTELHTKYGPY